MVRRLNPSPAPLPAWAGELPVRERTLSNGLKALVLPRRRAPIVVCDLYYPVGSFDEPPGLSGLAHFVEHMLFKGTNRFPKGQIDRLVLDGAGQSNAETSEDYTHYWFAFPSKGWELALAIEADRMRDAQFDLDEVEAERRVIGEERARELSSPQGRLDQTHLALTYLRHPYRNPIVGWPDDIARIGVDDLVTFYQTHYRTDGAVLVVVGDVDPEQALDAVSRHFAGLPAGALPRHWPTVVEPRQNGRRDFALSESESAVRGLLGWRTVPRDHRDVPALDVLGDLLCCGRRSRLWQSLVETQQTANWIEASHTTARRAGQFFLQVEAASEVDISTIEREIAAELVRLARTGPTDEELARSRRRLEAAWRWEHEDLTNLATGLGTAALWGDWRAWQAEHRAAMAVDGDEIRRVVAAHFVESNLTVGWSLPRTPSEQVLTVVPSCPLPVARCPLPDPSTEQRALATNNGQWAMIEGGLSRLVDYRPKRVVLDNGLRLIFERRPDSGVVALELYADAGMLREAKPGLACLTGRLLEEGTSTRTAQELAEGIEDVGGSLEVGATGGSVRVRCEDLSLAMDLLADVTLSPAFPAEALEWVARRIAAELRGDLEDPAFRAEMNFRGLIYGAHPLSRDPRGSVRDITRLTRQQAIEHHRRYFTPEHTILVAVGDFDPRRLASLVRARFGTWAPGGVPLPALPLQPKHVRPRVRRIHHPGEQVHIVLGHQGIARNHPDYEALTILDHIFGSGPGFSDRLGRILRDELGLVYAVGGGMTDSADVVPGLFRVYAGTTPDEAERVIATITEQVRAMHAGAFSDDEVERARRYVAGAWVFDFQSVEQRAERLLDLERWGLSLDEPKHWPERIATITPRQVRKAARTHLHPGALSRVELGPSRRRIRAEAECA
jgi:zinc protease